MASKSCGFAIEDRLWGGLRCDGSEFCDVAFMAVLPDDPVRSCSDRGGGAFEVPRRWTPG
jgi:hypothetical protein